MRILVVRIYLISWIAHILGTVGTVRNGWRCSIRSTPHVPGIDGKTHSTYAASRQGTRERSLIPASCRWRITAFLCPYRLLWRAYLTRFLILVRRNLKRARRRLQLFWRVHIHLFFSRVTLGLWVTMYYIVRGLCKEMSIRDQVASG